MNNQTDILAVLALGSNQGNRQHHLDNAMKRLEECVGTLWRTSSVIETPAWGYVSSNNYLNMVAAFHTAVPLFKLLELTQQIEREGGRLSKSHNGTYTDRPIDIDILFYGDTVFHNPSITVPHPHIAERRFVLQPLAEILPNMVHPVLKITVAQMLASLPPND